MPHFSHYAGHQKWSGNPIVLARVSVPDLTLPWGKESFQMKRLVDPKLPIYNVSGQYSFGAISLQSGKCNPTKRSPKQKRLTMPLLVSSSAALCGKRSRGVLVHCVFPEQFLGILVGPQARV